MRRVVVAIVVVVWLVGAVGVLLQQGLVRFNHPGRDEFPVQGVDVSHHQRRIDWSALKRSGSQFAYIKATEGATFRDPMFAANWRGASAVGIVPGAYHFFTLCRSGAEQAMNLLATLQDVSDPGLPPAIDLEFGGNCSRRPSADEFASELQVFIGMVERRLGCTPVLYVTQEFYPDYVEGRFPGAGIWIRDIYMRPELQGRPWLFWQFANRGRIAGVETFIDLNVFNGSTAEFEKVRCATEANPDRTRE